MPSVGRARAKPPAQGCGSGRPGCGAGRPGCGASRPGCGAGGLAVGRAGRAGGRGGRSLGVEANSLHFLTSHTEVSVKFWSVRMGGRGFSLKIQGLDRRIRSTEVESARCSPVLPVWPILGQELAPFLNATARPSVKKWREGGPAAVAGRHGPAAVDRPPWAGRRGRAPWAGRRGRAPWAGRRGRAPWAGRRGRGTVGRAPWAGRHGPGAVGGAPWPAAVGRAPWAGHRGRAVGRPPWAGRRGPGCGAPWAGRRGPGQARQQPNRAARPRRASGSRTASIYRFNAGTYRATARPDESVP